MLMPVVKASYAGHIVRTLAVVKVVVNSASVLWARRGNVDEMWAPRLKRSLETGGQKMAARVAQKSAGWIQMGEICK